MSATVDQRASSTTRRRQRRGGGWTAGPATATAGTTRYQLAVAGRMPRCNDFSDPRSEHHWRGGCRLRGEGPGAISSCSPRPEALLCGGLGPIWVNTAPHAQVRAKSASPLRPAVSCDQALRQRGAIFRRLPSGRSGCRGDPRPSRRQAAVWPTRPKDDPPFSLVRWHHCSVP
jgi:hypothetical protein